MNINIFQVIFQIINFTILLLLLRKYLYRPILKILEQRAKKIHEGLEAAEKSIDERETIEKEKKKVLIEAEKSATQILEGARLRAAKLEKQLSENAEKEMDRKLKRADRLAQTKLSQMELNLQKKFSQTVVDTTQTLLKDSLGVNEQREIIKRQLKRLRKIKFT